MKTVGIVAEYNPFHLGHAYHIREAKRLAGADAVVICMSGCFTQRGGYTLTDKFSRAEMALAGGADLVIELPVSFAVSSAERFAFGGVSLLSRIADVISCGVECDDVSLLSETASIVSSDDFIEKVKQAMGDGSSFAVAREKVMEREFPEGASILSKPNNILAIEYIKAINTCASPLFFLPLRRTGAGHGENAAKNGIASASLIREMPLENASAYLPEASFDILNREKKAGRLMDHADLWDASMLSYLRRLSAEELSRLPDVREGLENRLYDGIHSETTVEGIVNRANSRRYPSSRIRRMLMQAYLGLTSEEFSRFPSPLYIRPLAFNDVGRKLLASLRSGQLPILMRGGAYKSLPAEAKAMFEREIIADDLYTALYPAPCERKAFSDFYQPPIYRP